jgi:hypothetical protein
MNNATTKTVSEVAQAAKLIRAELAKAFPGTTFAVRSESFSMGNAVRIGWTDGPAFEAVDTIAQRFTSGSFDGMTDCYNYDSNRKGPTAKYVTCTRRTSDDLRATVVADLRAMFAAEPRDGFETLAYRILRRADLRTGYAGVRSVDGFPGFEVIPAATVSEAA